MSNFILDGTSLPYPKSDVTPYVGDGTKAIVATDWNTVCQALIDTRGKFVTTAAQTIYVATTGSDSNDGLTVGTPLLTVTEALKRVPYFVLAGHPVTINLAAGSYTQRILVPPMLLQDAVVVQAAAMTPTSPGAGIASGTFDASFGTQDFPHRAVVTGAGWTAGGLTGGWFVEILSGSLTGLTFPIVNNGTTTLDFATPCNASPYNFQGVSFRLVKPSVIVTCPSSSEPCVDASSPSLGGSNPLAAQMTFNNIEFRRFATGSPNVVRCNAGAYLRFNNCSFIDNSAGGGTLVSVQNQSVIRLDDCLAYRAGLRTNTNLLTTSTSANLTANRYGAHGGNFAASTSSTSSSIITRGFFYGQDTAMSVSTDSRVTTSSLAIDAAAGGASVSDWSVLFASSVTIKNSLNVGIMVGFSGFATSYPSAANQDSGGSLTLTASTIDSCPVGIGIASNSDIRIRGTSAITNCSSYGVNMGAVLSSGHNMVAGISTLTMTGNGADFTLDGSATYSLAALRALSPKAIVDTSRFNRLVEV